MRDEEKGDEQCAEKLMESREPLLVNSFTIDGDGCMAKGLKCMMRTRTLVQFSKKLMEMSEK